MEVWGSAMPGKGRPVCYSIHLRRQYNNGAAR